MFKIDQTGPVAAGTLHPTAQIRHRDEAHYDLSGKAQVSAQV